MARSKNRDVVYGAIETLSTVVRGSDRIAESEVSKVRALKSFVDPPFLPVTEGEIFNADADVVTRVPEAFEPV